MKNSRTVDQKTFTVRRGSKRELIVEKNDPPDQNTPADREQGMPRHPLPHEGRLYRSRFPGSGQGVVLGLGDDAGAE